MANQTRRQDLEGIEDEDLGTGFFLIPDVEDSQYGAARKIEIAGITYSDCIIRGHFTMEFKWVPNRVMEANPDSRSRCDAPCVDECIRLRCVCNQAVGNCI